MSSYLDTICEDCGAPLGDHRIGGEAYHPNPIRPTAEKHERDWQAYMQEAQAIGYRQAFQNALIRARQEENDACAALAKKSQHAAEALLDASANATDRNDDMCEELQNSACADCSAGIWRDIVSRRPVRRD